MSRAVREGKELLMPRHVERLYKAIANYVERSGGKVLVIGGIQIQEWPDTGKYNFYVAVKCAGKKPRLAK